MLYVKLTFSVEGKEQVVDAVLTWLEPIKGELRDFILYAFVLFFQIFC